MADLDADLYGDLYGNDEPEFAEQAGEEGATTETTSQPETSAKPAPKAAPAPSASTPATVDANQQKSAPANAPTPIASFMPVTQQIPTYEQPQPSEYRGAGAGDAYQNLSASERSVRPSEMKDEGQTSTVGTVQILGQFDRFAPRVVSPSSIVSSL
ncbi:hypothetical protein B0H16DRAFT_1722393 [Mycena metata]|uniref:Uncharacterized protein n=1 Tax=Mycena metata TaxID=1033252 RepID=A0AAD7J3Q3_9AGAR|nr:hypothetical protein B0H16DRAFT_1722393 [Mycena metata]